MNIKRMILLSTLLSLPSITLTWGFGKFSMNRVYSWFGKYSNEGVIEKEYQIANPASLTVNNIDGNIIITTDGKQDAVCLKAIKKTAKEEDLNNFSVHASREDRFDGHHITLSTACVQKGIKGSVTYNLMVPNHISLNLHTDRGTVRVQDVNGRVVVNTINGAIELNNIANIINAQTEESGTIRIDKVSGNIKATANKGDIIINNANKSIIATTQKGNIITTCNEVPATSRIVLSSESNGGITLALPSSVNATLQGKTNKGKFFSDHYVTIKPFTTKLTKQTRRELEKQVDGILGTGEADIRLTSNNGNIKIVETKTM